MLRAGRTYRRQARGAKDSARKIEIFTNSRESGGRPRRRFTPIRDQYGFEAEEKIAPAPGFQAVPGESQADGASRRPRRPLHATVFRRIRPGITDGSADGPTSAVLQQSRKSHVRAEGHSAALYLIIVFYHQGEIRQSDRKPKNQKSVLAYYPAAWILPSSFPGCARIMAADVIAMIGDVGQQEDLEAAHKKTLANRSIFGLHRRPARRVRPRLYLGRTLRAGAVYEHTYLLGTSMRGP